MVAFKYNKSSYRLGIGSFAYRYAIGFANFQPPTPLGVLDFMDKAHKLGYEGVQLCENLNYAALPEDQLFQVREKAHKLGMFVELGMRDISAENLDLHLKTAEILSSRFIRVVLGKNQPFPEGKDDAVRKELRNKAIETLKAVLPRLEKEDVTIGIENHFDLPTEDLVEIVKEIDHQKVGLIFDTTNGLGFTERPEETLEALKPYLLSVHLKDYTIQKVEAGYLISGTVLGEGLLPVEKIIRSALKANPGLSIILEMTVRRDEGRSTEEILAWEHDAIVKSTRFLKELLSG